MITFLQPLALLGLLAAAVPALLHLIERRVPPTVAFPAVRYLSDTAREHSRRLKLRNLLLLVLRTLLIALVALAAARPVAPWPFGGTHAPTAVALVVDNSLSSGVVLGGGRQMSAALAGEAQRVVARLGQGDHVWLVLADGVPRRVSAAEVAAALDSLAPGPQRMDLGAAVRAAARTLASDPLSSRQVIVLSDLQASALSGSAIAGVPVLVWAPPVRPVNRGVDSAWADPPVWRPDGAVVAAIGGEGPPVAVRLTLDGRDVAHALATPGEPVVLRAAPARRGWITAHVMLDPDELRGDDDAWLAVRSAVPVAVKAKPGAGRFVGDAVGVLVAAGRARVGDDVTLDGAVPERGAAVVFPPDDATLVGAVNRALRARGSTWHFGEVTDGEWGITGMAMEGATVLRRYQLLGPAEGGVVVARVAGQPWLVQDGNVLLVASRLDPAWTTLPLTAAFVPLLDRLIERLATGDAGVVRAAPGAPVSLPGAATMLLPAGPTALPPDGQVAAPTAPGVYFLTGAAGDTVGALVVNHDPRETPLTEGAPAAVTAALGSDATPRPTAAFERALFESGRRADLSGPLLALALVTAVVELGAATAGGRRS